MGRNRELKSILGQKIKRMKTIKQFEKTRLVEEIHEWLKKSQDLSRNSIEQSAVTFCIFIQKWLKSRLSYAPRSGPKARKKKTQMSVIIPWIEATIYWMSKRNFFFVKLRVFDWGFIAVEVWIASHEKFKTGDLYFLKALTQWNLMRV